MSSKQRKSSRKRMQTRIGKHKGKRQEPATYTRINQDQQEVSFYNRAMKKRIVAMSDKQRADERDKSTNKRKTHMAAARRVLRFIRKQTRKLMRSAAGE